MLVVRTSKCRAYSVGQLIGTKQTVGFDHFSLGMYPFGLHSVEPRALLGQQTADDPHSLLLALFQSPVAPTDPPSDLPAYVPTCVVPETAVPSGVSPIRWVRSPKERRRLPGRRWTRRAKRRRASRQALSCSARPPMKPARLSSVRWMRPATSSRTP